MIKQIFKIDRKFWTQTQCDEIQVFFQFNSFYSKFYEHKDFDRIIGMTYYVRIHRKSPIYLQNSKRPEAMVLLSGRIDIQKKISPQNGKRPMKKGKQNNKISQKEQENEQLFENYTTLNHQNESILVQSSCKVTCLDQKEAQILFVPSILYNQHIKYLEDQKIEVLFKGLRTFFPQIQRKALVNLAKSGCHYKEFRINQCIYRAGDLPQEVYLIMEGNVKLQKPGFSAKKNVRHAHSKSQINVRLERHKTFASIEKRYLVLSICKNFGHSQKVPMNEFRQFLRFAKQYLTHIEYLNEDQSSYTLPTLNKNPTSLYIFDRKQLKKKTFTRFHSSNKLESQHFIETKLIKNCHILVSLSPKGSKTGRLQGNSQLLKDYSKDQFKQKLKLFKRIRPNNKKLDLQNPLIQWTPKRRSSLKSQIQNAED